MDYIDMPHDVLAYRLERCVEDRNEALAQQDDLLAALKTMRENYYDIDSRCLALADAAIARVQGD